MHIPSASPTLAGLSLAALFCSVALHTGAGCNAIPAVTADVGQVTICVEQAILTQVQAGATTFEDIAVAIGASCGVITAQEVQNIINLWTSGDVDAGTTTPFSVRTAEMQAKLKAIHHKQ
jgi:hypothetical protein